MGICDVFAGRKIDQGMGELILCSRQMAAMPYYIEEVSLNVYSLEELSYYIEQNLCLMKQDFMSEELCLWVEQELGMTETAQTLREIQSGGTLSEFVFCLLSASGYCNAAMLENIRHTLQELEHISAFECGKIRADRYLENRKYVSAIYEYRRLLREEPAAEQDLKGAVWHNLGTAYARMFLFDRAAECYTYAYETGKNEESLRACLAIYLCSHDVRGFQRKISAYGIGEEMKKEIETAVTEACSGEAVDRFGEWLQEQLALDTAQGMGSDEIGSLLAEWKNEYRKNCEV